MKKLSLLIAILCFWAGMCGAATISGTVTNATTGAPIPNFRVYVRDSLNTYRDSTLTGFNGVYAVTLPASVTYNRIIVSILTCGSQYQSLYYGGASLTASFSTCAGSPSYNLYGTVSLGGTSNTGVTRLYLISKQYDTSMRDTTLTVVDSFSTAGTGGTFSKTYLSAPFGKLLLKAALPPGHPSYASYPPTYFGGSLIWSAAANVDSSRFRGAATNVSMVAGVNPGGAGFIGGSVLVGANKTSAVGDPLSGRILLLTNGAGQAVSYTYSNAGKFSFSNLAFGTYKVFGDAGGKSNPALTLTLTSAKSQVSNIIFEENDTTFRAHFASLAVSNSIFSHVTVYPNPVGSRLYLAGLDGIDGAKAIIMRDITGAILLRQSFAAGDALSVNTAALPAGIYLMQLQTEAGNASFRVIK